MPRYRLTPWALIAFVLGAVVLVLFLLAPTGTSIDYAVFHRAGERFLRGRDLYQPADGGFVFKYAPVAAAFFAPLSLLPPRLGWLAINVVSIVALLRALQWSASHLTRSPGLFTAALTLAMAAPYYGHLFWLGQSDGLVLWLLVESEQRAQRRPWLSGALWALACLLKPPFLVVLLHAALQNQWKRIAGLVLGIALSLAAGVVRYGPAAGLAQLRGWSAILQASTPELLCIPYNQSAFAIACTYLAPAGTGRFAAALALLALAVVAAGLGVALLTTRADRQLGQFALAGFAFYLGAFLSPLGWNTNLIAALPLAFVLASLASGGEASRLRWTALTAAIAVAALNCLDLLLAPLKAWPDTAMTLLQLRQYGIAGLVLAGSSLACLARHARQLANVQTTS